MDAKIIRDINVDFYDNKLITINAKQNDKLSRYIRFTCYNQKELFVLDSASQKAYIRYKKADDNGVMNSCTITSDGKVLVELTEQMLVVAGNSYADIMIMDNDGHVLSTMNVCVNVIPSALDNTEIESSGEYNALYELMEKALADYEYVMENAQASANAAKVSENNAKTSETNAKNSETKAKASETNANTSETNAAKSASAAKTSENNAKTSETNAKNSETNAKNSENIAITKANESSASATLSKSYAVGGTGTRTGENTDNSKYYSQKSQEYKESIEDSANIARSYAVGDTGTRTGEETDNAQYYYEQSKIIVQNLQVASLTEVETYLGI